MRRRLDRLLVRGLIALAIGLGVTALAPLLHQLDHHDDHEHVGAAIVYHEHAHPHPHPHEHETPAPEHGENSPLHGALLLGDAVDRAPRFHVVETLLVRGAFETARAPFAARIAHRLRGPPRA